jgi:hypothetical protein
MLDAPELFSAFGNFIPSYAIGKRIPQQGRLS